MCLRLELAAGDEDIIKPDIAGIQTVVNGIAAMTGIRHKVGRGDALGTVGLPHTDDQILTRALKFELAFPVSAGETERALFGIGQTLPATGLPIFQRGAIKPAETGPRARRQYQGTRRSQHNTANSRNICRKVFSPWPGCRPYLAWRVTML
jgi:hypothetical protein